MDDSSTPLPSVFEQVAAYEQVQPKELPPLEDAVPSDIYTRLTTAWPDQTEPIAFTYVWYQVTVYPSGVVIVKP